MNSRVEIDDKSYNARSDLSDQTCGLYPLGNLKSLAMIITNSDAPSQQLNIQWK